MPLEIHIQGFEIANFEARMQAMTRPAFAALNNYATDGKPALLFVPTRKHARLVALDLLTFAAAEGLPRKYLQVRLFLFVCCFCGGGCLGGRGGWESISGVLRMFWWVDVDNQE